MKKLILLLTLNILFSQTPHKMSFQAYLTDNNNMPIVVYCILNTVSVQMYYANGVRVHAHCVICSNTNGSCVLQLCAP